MKTAYFVRSFFTPVFFSMAFLIGVPAGGALAATGAGHGPQSDWSQMQKFEYYLGDLAGALNLCRRYSLYQQLRELANMTPYGRKGLEAWLVYDGVRGCPGLSKAAEEILQDKDRILEYLQHQYDCSSGECLER